MKKIKITDCVSQAQPQLETTVYNENHEEIARLRHLTFREQTMAQQFALNLKSVKNFSDNDLQVNSADLVLKELEFAIIDWCFEEKPTCENINKITSSSQGYEIFKKILEAHNEMKASFENNKEAIVKN